MNESRPRFKTVAVAPQNPAELKPRDRAVKKVVAPQMPEKLAPRDSGVTKERRKKFKIKKIRLNKRPKFEREAMMFLLPAVLIIIVIVIIGGIVARRNGVYDFSAEVEETPMPSLAPATPTPSPVPVSRLKSYLNALHGFSFRYPEDLVLLECSSSVKLYKPDSVDPEELCSGATSMGIISVEFSESLPLDSFLAELTEYSVKTEIIKVDGMESVKKTLLKVKEFMGPDYAVFVTSRDGVGVFYMMSVTGGDLVSSFDTIVNSFKYKKKDVTEEWETYEDEVFNYEIKYPGEWSFSVVGEASRSDDKGVINIKKVVDEPRLNNLVIETQNGLEEAGLTASGIVATTRSLAGWVGSPTVDIRNIGGGTAQIIQGQQDSTWQTYVVVWFKNRLVQMSWVDDVKRGEQETFDNILSTFSFTE